MTKKKSAYEQYMDESKSHIRHLCSSVTEGRRYQELYGISRAVRRCDSDNLLVSALVLVSGFLIWLVSILWPLLMYGRFHMGMVSAIGVILISISIAYYLGGYRILHPLSKYTADEKDDRIYEILKNNQEDVRLIDQADNPTETTE